MLRRSTSPMRTRGYSTTATPSPSLQPSFKSTTQTPISSPLHPPKFPFSTATTPSPVIISIGATKNPMKTTLYKSSSNSSTEHCPYSSYFSRIWKSSKLYFGILIACGLLLICLASSLYALHQSYRSDETMLNGNLAVSPFMDADSVPVALRKRDNSPIAVVNDIENGSPFDKLEEISRKMNVNVESDNSELELVSQEIPLAEVRHRQLPAEERYDDFADISTFIPRVYPALEISRLLKEAQDPIDPITKVPNIVHFVYGLGKSSPAKPVPFSITQYLAIKSALDVIKANHVHLWMRNTPPQENKWWSLTLEMGKLRSEERGWPTNSSLITIHPTRDVTTVFGKEVDHHAHKADIIRLEALLTYGGIYLDMDVIAIKSFDELLEAPCTMGLEQLDTNKHPHGLGNAVIICHRASPWLTEWYNSYRKFNNAEWAALSVHLPLKLARSYPHYVQSLNYDAFFRPVWSSTGMADLYVHNTYNLRHNYAVHLWGGGNRYRNQDSFEQICALQTTWGRIARIALLAGNGNKDLCKGFPID